MHRTITLLLLTFVFLSGCTATRFYDNNIENIIKHVLYKDKELHNISSSGYKYYIPKGVRLIDNTEFNDRLSANGNTYFLYVDIVSYYFNTEIDFKENDKAYYSKGLKYNDQAGYIEINKINDKYFIEMMYNYAKIETWVNEKHINDTIVDLSYILSSVSFNDNVIKLMFDKNILNYKEEKYNIFEPRRKEGNFLDYIRDFDKYQGEIDEDIIILDQEMVE
jgi:hypothetical protein